MDHHNYYQALIIGFGAGTMAGVSLWAGLINLRKRRRQRSALPRLPSIRP